MAGLNLPAISLILKIKKTMRLKLQLFATLAAALVACGDDSKQVITPTPEPEPKPEGPIEGYQKIWADEFDGDQINSLYWTIETTTGANQEKQYYTDRPENIRVKDGCLEIEARKESFGGREYTSGRLNSKSKIQFKYGYLEARIWLPSGRGTWPAFWMLGTASVWPACGEIDIMEHSGNNPSVISHALHTLKNNTSNGHYWSKAYEPEGGAEGVWHTYAILWEEDADAGDDTITFLVDGVQSAKQFQPHGIDDTSQWPFCNYFYIVMNMAMGGLMGGEIDDSVFDSEVLMKVDYVRLYQKI